MFTKLSLCAVLTTLMFAPTLPDCATPLSETPKP